MRTAQTGATEASQAGPPAPPVVAGAAPDVLLIYTDQWRWDALGCLGSDARTPVLDSLAAAGVHFDHAVVQSPVCMPSRASLLTGRYPSALGITQMGVPVPEDTVTLATVLSSRGYRTANVGKLHFLPHANRDHTSPHPRYGFDMLALSDEPGVYEDDYRAWVRAAAPEAPDQISLGLPPAAQVWQDAMGVPSSITHSLAGPRNDYAGVHVFPADASLTHSAWVATRTIEHLDSLAPGQPALTIASFFSPHSPYQVPQQFLDLYDRDDLALPSLSADDCNRQESMGITDDQLRAIRHGYYASISEVDYHVGRILTRLDELGRSDNTVVVFVSDHGEWLGDHLRFAKGYQADDPVSRVPLIVRWPRGVQSPGRCHTEIVEAVDLFPTVLACAGIPVPTTAQGYSLLPILRGEPADRPAVGITEHAGWRSVRTAYYHYLVHEDGSESLWHLAADPGEIDDVVAGPDHQQALQDHRLLLIQHALRTEHRLERTWPY